MAKTKVNERLQFVCQYCYSPVVMGRPIALDFDKQTKTSPSNSSPSKSGKPSGSKRSLNRGNRALSPSAVNRKETMAVAVDEFARRSPEEAFESFQKVLLELEKENEAKGNSQLRVTSINPLVLMPLSDETDTGKVEADKSSDDKETANGATTEITPNPYLSDRTTTETDNEEVQSPEEQPVLSNERTPAQIDSSLLPYSKEHADAVFDSLSECSALDFPMCCACADALIDNLDVKGQLLTRECRALVEQKLEEQKMLEQICPEGDLDEIIAQLEGEEAGLLEELKQLESEKDELDSVNKQLAQEELRMVQEEKELSTENNQLQQEIYELETSLKSVTEQLKFAEDHFNVLKKTNVFNLVFNIWHQDNKIGTINGFRLGKLNSDSQAVGPGGASIGRVEWGEINMALGQSCLLLHCLIAKLNFQPNIYTLVPCGARSYIESAQPSPGGGAVLREKLNLYNEGGNKFFYDSSIDSAMKAFLNILDQFRATLEQKNSEFRLPYPMKGDLIYEKQGTDICYSVCPGKSSSEMWTKACRLMLTNLKWGIVGVGSICPHPADWLQPQSGVDNNNRESSANRHHDQLRGRADALSNTSTARRNPQASTNFNQQLHINPPRDIRAHPGVRNGNRN